MFLLFLALFFISVLRVILRIWLITLIVASPIGDIFWWAFVRLLLLLSAVTLILLFGGFVLLVSFRSFLLLVSVFTRVLVAFCLTPFRSNSFGLTAVC